MTACPGCAFSLASGGVYPPEPPPFPRLEKGGGNVILCLIAFPVINTTCRLSCGLMIATICNNFVSAFVWGVCFSKVQSFKGENGCKVLISVISIALQTLNILL